MVGIEVSELYVELNGNAVLRGITFSLGLGKVCAVLGPNGAGKTTLLRTIARFIKPVKGSIKILGRDYSSYSRSEFYKLVAYSALEVPRGFRFSVRDVLEASLYSYRLRRDEVDKRIEWVSNLLDIYRLLHRRIDTLSSGELQLVTLAIALVKKPRILLLDEPTAHLDIRHQLEVSNLIRRISRELSIATLVATHDIRIAIEYSDHILLIDRGKQVAFGDPNTIIESNILEKVYGVRISILRHGGRVAITASI